jgi:2-phospho-L-lactate guanylyltransferase
MTYAVVPVKALPSSKSRLRRDFDGAIVERLAAAMLRDVVGALVGVPALARVVVVTPDAGVAETARKAGAEALVRDDPGLNPAIEVAAAEIAGSRGDGVLVVLGDVAGARSEEIAQLLNALDGPGVALAPSRDGGTSALLRVPRDVIPAGFGPHSAKVHRERAAEAGVRFRELSLPSLAIDVDRREDLTALLASHAPAPHTRALWNELRNELETARERQREAE